MTGVAKVKSAIEYLDDLLFERGIKLLVFAHHQNILVCMCVCVYVCVCMDVCM
jgi:hypothetical protein